MRMLPLRTLFVRVLFVCAALVLLVVCFFVAPRLVKEIERVSIASALENRFGKRLRYEQLSPTDTGWMLTNVQVDTSIAQITCAECHLNTRSFSASLAAVSAEADVRWLDHTLPLCRIELKEGSGRLINPVSQETFLTWTPHEYQLNALPCPIALPLLNSLNRHHPLEPWVAESGQMSGRFTRSNDALFDSVDLTVTALSLRLIDTPLRLILDEGKWSSTAGAPCQGSALLRCTLSNSSKTPVRVLEIPKEEWNLSISQEGALLNLQSDLATVWRFLSAVQIDPEPLLLEMKLPLNSNRASGHLFLKRQAITLPFDVELKKGKKLQATLQGHRLPLSLFFSPFLPGLLSTFLPTTTDLSQVKLHGFMDLKATLDYPKWLVESDVQEASVEVANCLFSVGATEGPICLKGNLARGPYLLDANVLRVDGVHVPSGNTFDAWSGKVHIDKDKISAENLDGYVSGVHLTGDAHYYPLQSDSSLSLHLTGASGKISTFRKLFKNAKPFHFLAQLPCEGDLMLSKEGALFTWTPKLTPHYQLSGSIVDLKILDTSNLLTTHDLSCKWRYDSSRHALDLYNLHGALLVDDGTESGESYFLQADRFCSFDDSSSTLAFDFSVSDSTEEMLRLAGEVDSQSTDHFKVELCPLRSHFSFSHPKQLLVLLKPDGSLYQMDCKILLQLEKNFKFLQRLSRVSYCTIDPLFTEALSRLNRVQGACEVTCSYNKETSHLGYQLQSDLLTIDSQDFRNCLLRGKFSREENLVDALEWNGWRLSTTLKATATGWKIPYLAFQHEDTLLGGFEGEFISSTHTLKGHLPLVTWHLPPSPLYPAHTRWTGQGEVSYRPSLKKTFFINLSLQGTLKNSLDSHFEKESLSDSFLRYLPPLHIHVEGSKDNLVAAIQPQGDLLPWPIRPCSCTLKQEPEGYLLEGSLEDPKYPFWVQSHIPSSLTLPREWSFYDAYPLSKTSLTICLPAQETKQIAITGALWGYTCDLGLDLTKETVEGTLAWKTLQGGVEPPSLLRTPLHDIPLKASWNLKGSGTIASSYQGTLSVSDGLINKFPIPPWEAKLAWQPAELTLQDVVMKDPYFSCTLQKLQIQRGAEPTFHLTHLSAQEKPFHAKPKERICFPWHPHMTFPAIEVASLSGSLNDPIHCSGEGMIQFHRPSTQKRIAKEDPMHKLIPLPDVLTPTQGTLYWSVEKGTWQIKEIKQAYSERKVVEFLLLPSRPSFISDSGQLDVTLQAKPAKHRLRNMKRHVFHLQGPVWQPSCILENEERKKE